MGKEGRTLQATLIVQKKRELNQVQAGLEKKRSEFKKRMDECAKKREELRAKVRLACLSVILLSYSCHPRHHPRRLLCSPMYGPPSLPYPTLP